MAPRKVVACAGASDGQENEEAQKLMFERMWISVQSRSISIIGNIESDTIAGQSLPHAVPSSE